MQATDRRIRQVAIVLQSLDASTAKSLLGQLPPEVGRQVKTAMVKLGPVSSAERAEAMNGLQGLFATTPTKKASAASHRQDSPAAAILAEHSALDELEWSEDSTSLSKFTPTKSAPLESEVPWLAWEPSSLATFLANERPTVIATVLNQLSAERAKQVLDHLPVETAGATLAAIPSLFLADPSILNDILAEIERKLPKQPPSQTTATIAGIAKLSAIVDQFQGGQRQAWLKSIASQNRDVALQLGWVPDPTPEALSHAIDSKPTTPAPSLSKAADSAPSQSTSGRPNPLPEPSISIDLSKPASDNPTIIPIHLYQSDQPTNDDLKQLDAPRFSGSITPSSQSFDDLLTLSDGDMVTLLHACNRIEVLRSLRHCSREMLHRIETLIPKQDLKKFRAFYKQFQSITAQDSELAQKSILAHAERMIAAGTISSSSSVSYLAAA